MSKEIVVANGVFSSFRIVLNDEVNDKLALIRTKKNPLAVIEGDMQRLLDEFEVTYFKLLAPPQITPKETEAKE